MSALDDFLRRHGIGPVTMRRIRSGRNSEVSHITQGNTQWVLKHYYRQPQDPRDRLGVEYGFLTFLADVRVPCVPRPVGKDTALGYALYSFLPGERPGVLTPGLVSAAAKFVASLQEHRQSVTAEALPAAADACFSLREHVALMTTRVARLSAVRPESEAERSARAFVVNRLAPLCERLQQRLARDAGDAESLPREARILSPSDFGFHNTLLHEGRLSFVDFEYAGFDDPAKLMCDFRCQPELPVSEPQGQQFCVELSRALANGGAVLDRAEIVLPVHRLKWCCILLNELRSEDRNRRMHASGAVEPEALLAAQLEKAQRYFDEHLASLT